MTQCFQCGTYSGRKRWYTFPVEARKLSHLDRIDVKEGKITRMLCVACAKELNAEAAANPHKMVTDV